MTRIALVVSHFPSPEHPYIWDWVKGLILAGLDITVITENTLEDSAIYSDPNLLKHIVLLNSITSLRTAVSLNWRPMASSSAHPGRLLAAIRILIRQEQRHRSAARKLYEYLPILHQRFDIVHFNGPQIAIRRFELGRIFKAKTLVSFRGQDFTFHPDRYDSLLYAADHLHFISEHLLREARKRGYDGSKHSLIPPTIDTGFYHPQTTAESRRNEGPLRLFTAARFSWTKGWEFALQAVALLVGRGIDVHYYIAGEGDFRDAVLYTIYELNLTERVHLLGWLPPEKIREWMWKADLYVLASVEEAFNNSVLQAQACGLPVVCSDAGGLPENIIDGETGVLARRRDAWDLADKMQMLLQDGELRRKLLHQDRKLLRDFRITERSSDFFNMYTLLANRQKNDSCPQVTGC